MTTCWCGDVHPEQPSDVAEAWEKLWHEVMAALYIPEIVEWLDKRLSRWSR